MWCEPDDGDDDDTDDRSDLERSLQDSLWGEDEE